MIDLLLAMLPGPVHAWIRRLRGQQIHRTARLSLGVLIHAREVVIGPGAQIRPLVRIRTDRLELGEDSTLGPLTTMAANRISVGSQSAVAPLTIVSGDPSQSRSFFVMGDHSKVFPFCWLEPGHGITLGDRVGIGGHGLIFTHGSWANYFRGAPVGFGPVVIEDRVWLPWRVFVMPNVVIGERAIIGAGSVITRDIPADALAAGSPAKVVRPTSYEALTGEGVAARLDETMRILRDENAHLRDADLLFVRPGDDLPEGRSGQVVVVAGIEPDLGARLMAMGASVIDVLEERAWLSKGDRHGREIASWFSRYGVRFDVQSPGGGPRG